MRYAIDGSNALLGLRIDRKPSVRLFCRLLLALKERHDEFQIFFDENLRNIMAREGLQDEWSQLLDALRAEGITSSFAIRADPLIEKMCREQSAAVINSSDKMDSWNARPSVIHRARAFRSRAGLHVTLINDANGHFVLRAPAHEPFAFGAIQFPPLNATEAIIEGSIAVGDHVRIVPEGVLLVLALDASGSMTEKNSYDGRAKSEHLNDIVRSTLGRLRSSAISEALYVGILRFENDVTPLPCPETGTLFASIDQWESALPAFDYLAGIRPGQTNIRLALQRAKEVIQETLADKDSISRLADGWRATVVLITDGKHYVERRDGTVENDKDVAEAALKIHMGAPDLIGGRIDVGCVGIGTDVNAAMLSTIASSCTPQQLRIARVARIGTLLNEEKLFIKVDSADPGFPNAIRTFIDVASASAV